jgi:hypothetical protein
VAIFCKSSRRCSTTDTSTLATAAISSDQYQQTYHSAAFAKVAQYLEIRLDLGQEDHPDCRPPYINPVLHACELRRQFVQLGLVRLDQEAHVVVDEG